MKHIGMDVHSTTTSVTVLNDRGRKILQREIPTREFDFIDFFRSIQGPKQVVLEESQMADCVTRWIEPLVQRAIRCQPQHNRLISQSENKCDKQDSHSLAELLYMDKLKVVHHPAWEYRQLREAVRAYWITSRDLTRARNRLKAFCLYNGVHCTGDKVYSKRYRDQYERRLQGHSANLKLLGSNFEYMDFCRQRKAAHIRLMRKMGKPFQEEMRSLESIPGIGFIGAFTLLAYLEKGWRIPNKRKLWRYCGIGIRRHDSNKVEREGASYEGNRYLKNVLFTAVCSIAAGRTPDNALVRLWQAGVAGKVHPDRLRRNLARKIAVVAQHALRFKEKYDDERIVTTQ